MTVGGMGFIPERLLMMMMMMMMMMNWPIALVISNVFHPGGGLGGASRNRGS